jgi:hypothetical protein
MAAAKKQQSYTVQARIVVEGDLEVRAESLDEALAKAKELKLDDFITVTGGHNDSSLRITGVFGPYKPIDA